MHANAATAFCCVVRTEADRCPSAPGVLFALAVGSAPDGLEGAGASAGGPQFRGRPRCNETVMRAALMSDERRLRSAVLPPLAICVVQERQRCRQLPTSPRGEVRRACDSRSINCVDDTSGGIKRCCSRSLLSYISMLELSNHNDRLSIAPCMVMESQPISLKLSKERIP
jgi:hypothetical protein